MVRRRGFDVYPALSALWRKTGPLYIYWEAYGIGIDGDGSTSVSVEVAIRPAGDRGGVGALVSRLFERTRNDGVSTVVAVDQASETE